MALPSSRVSPVAARVYPHPNRSLLHFSALSPPLRCMNLSGTLHAVPAFAHSLRVGEKVFDWYREQYHLTELGYREHSLCHPAV